MAARERVATYHGLSLGHQQRCGSYALPNGNCRRQSVYPTAEVKLARQPHVCGNHVLTRICFNRLRDCFAVFAARTAPVRDWSGQPRIAARALPVARRNDARLVIQSPPAHGPSCPVGPM